MCRTRRIKCDETKPTCNQCAKSRRQCPGYEDEFNLVFRDETQATKRRACKAYKKTLAKAGKLDGEIPGGFFVADLVVAKEVVKSPMEQDIIPALNVPVETQTS